MKELCDIPINPTDNTKMVIEADLHRESFAKEHLVTPTRHINVRSVAFIVIRELARAIANGTDWNKKARIVLEYDPQAEKMPITIFMESDELPPPGDRLSC